MSKLKTINFIIQAVFLLKQSRMINKMNYQNNKVNKQYNL